MATQTYPEFTGETYSYASYQKDAAPGLGTWSRRGDYWIYTTPKGLSYPVSANWRKPEPPPLPKPQSQRRQCGCWQGPHTCSQCGEPYFVEIHGMADGYCTYCYHRG